MGSFNFIMIEEIVFIYFSELSYQILFFEYTWWWLFGFVGGLLFTFGWALQQNFWGVLFSFIGFLIISFQPVLFFIGDDLANYFLGQVYNSSFGVQI